jgi:DNA-binding transcriptional regulator YiaG
MNLAALPTEGWHRRAGCRSCHLIAVGAVARAPDAPQARGEIAMADIPELSEADFERSLRRDHRQRLMAGEFRNGQDIADLRAFVGLTQVDFAQALGISVRTLQGWEQDRRRPEGPSLALLRIAARHPRFVRENLAS